MAWIRDQGKVYLADVREFFIKEASQKTNTQTAIMGMTNDFDGNYGALLGTFPDREAALVELDRIEAWIADGGKGVYQISGE